MKNWKSTKPCGNQAVIGFFVYVKLIWLNKENHHLFHYFQACKEDCGARPYQMLSISQKKHHKFASNIWSEFWLVVAQEVILLYKIKNIKK